jgi:hypothetical protein
MVQDGADNSEQDVKGVDNSEHDVNSADISEQDVNGADNSECMGIYIRYILFHISPGFHVTIYSFFTPLLFLQVQFSALDLKMYVDDDI